jgi:hypothetical protein
VRKEKHGAELDLYVMSKCHELISQLDDEAKEPMLEWLTKRVRADQLAKRADLPTAAQ